MEAPARYPVLCKKALKSALNLHRKQTVIDTVKFRLVLSHSFAMSLCLEMLTGNKACSLKKLDFGLCARFRFLLNNQCTSRVWLSDRCINCNLFMWHVFWNSLVSNKWIYWV